MLDAFENALATAPIGMGLIDLTGHFLQVNEALCRMTGYQRGELILLSGIKWYGVADLVRLFNS